METGPSGHTITAHPARAHGRHAGSRPGKGIRLTLAPALGNWNRGTVRRLDPQRPCRDAVGPDASRMTTRVLGPGYPR